MKHHRFNYRGTFTCAICKRRTRDTGQGVDHLCEPCYEIAGMDNAINDGCDDKTAAAYRHDCEKYLAKIAKKGGDVKSVKSQNSYVWPAK